MEPFQTLILWLYVPAALLALLPAVYGLLTAANPAARLFTGTMFVILGWIVTDFLERSAPTWELKLFWRNLCYVPIGLLPVLWFALVIHLIGRAHLLNPRVWVGLLVIPFLLNVGAWTNDWHHGVALSLTLVDTPIGPAVAAVRGPVYVLYYTYATVLNLASVGLLAWSCRHREPLFVRQFLGFFLGQVIVLLPNFLYMLGVPPFANVDLTPMALGVASLAFAWGVFRFRGFDAIPITRSTLVENLEAPIVVVDRWGRAVDFNPAAAQAFALLPTALGRPLGVADQLPQVLRDFLRLGSPGATTLESEGRWFDVRGNWIRRSHRDEDSFAAVLVDVTEKHQAEARLALQQQSLLVLRERERLAQDLHDSLGQQLGFLNLSAQTLGKILAQGRCDGIAVGLEKMAIVAREANDDVRAFLTESPHHGTTGFVDQLGDLGRRWLRSYEFRVDVEAQGFSDHELDPVRRSQLFKVVQEALNNARKHSGQAFARVVLSRSDDQFRVVVEDRGRGFDPGAPVVAESLGLGIMRDRAQRAGARLHVESAHPGTRVVLTFDLRAPEPPGAEAAPVEPGASRLRLVIADDNVLYAEGLADLLTVGGYQVVGQARDGNQALELVRQLVPDVLLLDIQMPHRDGLSTVRAVSRACPATRVVMLTVSASQDDLFEALRGGASGYLLKNVDSQELFGVLDGLSRGEAAITAETASRILAETAPARGEDALEGLTTRQREVLELVAQGLTYKEVGAKLYLSEPTIKYHMGEILGRLQLKTRGEAERLVRRVARGPQETLVARPSIP